MKAEHEKVKGSSHKQKNLLVIGIAILVVLIIIMLGFEFYQQPPQITNNQTTIQNNTSQVSVNKSQPQPAQNSTTSNITNTNISNQTTPPKTISGFCYDGTPVEECNNQGQYCTISHTFIYDCNGNPTLGIPACGCGSGLKCVTSGAQTGECLPS